MGRLCVKLDKSLGFERVNKHGVTQKNNKLKIYIVLKANAQIIHPLLPH